MQEQSSGSQQRRGLQKYTARCHVADISRALLASMNQPNPGSIYNVVDDHPASRAEAMHFARQLLAGESATTADRPKMQPSQGAPADVASLDPAVGGVLGEKRVRNHKIKSELSISWEFPSYREGLAAIHAGTVSTFGWQ